MPRIFDNIENGLLPALRGTLEVSERADFCVGYFNLRGWKSIDDLIEVWPGGPERCCRVLVGMQRPPQDDLRDSFRLGQSLDGLDNQTALRLKRRLAGEFRDQLMIGAPANEDEAGLRRLARQIRGKKVVVKLFLRHPLHAKLYLAFRTDPNSPVVGFLGSSNLTFAGLYKQGELNVDVLDQDACQKLARWFEERWLDRWCIDISKELLEIIEESWAREKTPPPYHVYVKMAYHLSREARAGLTEFRLPSDFKNKLFSFQEAAVKIAARHLNERGGVLIGDVVGLGKTLMAAAVARIFEDDHDLETLIICPKNLTAMWQDYRERYRLRGRVLSLSKVIAELPRLRRYRLVLIDESHNLRNREGMRYHAIHDYIHKNESKVILLSATPYNKTYIDLANQLRLFISEDADTGLRPENLLRELGETEFLHRYQCPVRSLAAFEKSEYADDWRELMRLFLVRRTRSFIKEHYAQKDESGREFLTFPDGSRSYFPRRTPKTVRFKIDEGDPSDQYALLYADPVVDAVNNLKLPRYGLGNYIDEEPDKPPTPAELRIIADLSRAGKRLMGFCRTNLFKRLESSGQAFLLSVERHVLRNFVFLHALENDEAVPIGTQDAAALDTRFSDDDGGLFSGENDSEAEDHETERAAWTEPVFRERASRVYDIYRGEMNWRFRWLPARLFRPALSEDLLSDARDLLGILEHCGEWRPERDRKLLRLLKLIRSRRIDEKMLIFSQFADTVRYLADRLRAEGVAEAEAVTGDSENPAALAWRFSPVSNERQDLISPEEKLDILIATDVLSEGQNLQDCSTVVNFDLPWAIIRLIQRAGRVDRIGQQAEEIRCHTFLPAEGVDRIIRLRSRLRQRLRENAEVVGTDEAFFEDDRNEQSVHDLFTEKSGILDADADTEVDLGSMAYGIWKRAVEADPSLEKKITDLPDVVYSTKHAGGEGRSEGVLAYIRTASDHDSLVRLDAEGKTVTESQFDILRAAECAPGEPALPRLADHHKLVRQAVELAAKEEKSTGGQLGGPRNVRFRAYERLKRFADDVQATLFDTQELRRAIEDIYKYPLRQVARDTLNRQLRAGIGDEDLARLVVELREEGRLSAVRGDGGAKDRQPRIICSLGLSSASEARA